MGTVHITTKRLLQDALPQLCKPYQFLNVPTAAFKICPDGEICNSNLIFHLSQDIIHEIDMSQSDTGYAYEVGFMYSVEYEIVFEYEIRLLPKHRWNSSKRVADLEGNSSADTFIQCYGQTCYKFWPARNSVSWNEANETCFQAK